MKSLNGEEHEEGKPVRRGADKLHEDWREHWEGDQRKTLCICTERSRGIPWLNVPTK